MSQPRQQRNRKGKKKYVLKAPDRPFDIEPTESGVKATSPAFVPGKKGVKKVPKKLRGNKAKIYSKVGVNDTGKGTNLVVQVTANVQTNDTYKRQSELSVTSLAELFSCFMSRLISLGATLDPEIDYAKFYSGYKFMMQGCMEQIQGRASLVQLPKIMADWVAALKPKEIKYHGFAAVSYGWNEFSSDPQGTSDVSVGSATWELMVPGVDTGLWSSPAIPSAVLADEVNYPYFLKVCDELSQVPKIARLMSTQELETYKSPLCKDASAFAYTYGYFGLTADTTTAWWNNAESMTNITAPALAKYVPYPNAGPITFTSNKYIATCGGPSQFLSGLADLPVSYFNKTPINYKPIDLQDVINRLIAFYQNAIVKRLTTLQGSIDPTIQMTYQDFKILVRQMVLANAPAQFLGQFEGPNTIATNSNFFQALMVTASTVPSAFFKNTRIPQILAENLAMLKEFGYEYMYGKKSKSNFAQFVPIWGVYPGDLPLNPTININGVDIPIFLPSGSGGQQEINLVNGSYGGVNNPSYVNFNTTYYEGLVQVWNDKIAQIQDVCAELATNNRATAGKVPYAMFVTKIINTVVNDGKVVAWNKLNDRMYGPRLVKSGSKKEITLPPGTPNNLHQEALVSSVPLPQEVYGVLQVLVTPSVRIDITGQAILSTPMWKSASGELLTVQLDTSNSPTLFAQAGYFGDFCVTGVGRDTGNELDTAMKVLTGKGEGGALADMLAGLLGTIIPGGGPVFKTLASLVPI